MRKQQLLNFVAILTLAACGKSDIPVGEPQQQPSESKEQPPEPDLTCSTADPTCPNGYICLESVGLCKKNCQNNSDCTSSCEYCNGQSHTCEPFPKGEKIGDCSGEFEECNGQGQCACIGNHTGNDCRACKLGFAGHGCDECAEGFTGNQCNQCLSGRFGQNCELCNCGSLQCNDGINEDGSCYSCPEGFTGLACDKCLPRRFGQSCAGTCTCANDTCKDGLSGDGHCSLCDGDYYGPDCDKKHTCKNGTPSIGLSGTGHCLNCNSGYWGLNCDSAVNCAHGTPSEGLNGTGKCLSCTGNYWGENCASDTITCIHGTPSIGINGNGKCQANSCASTWAGDNCEHCDDQHYGEDCSKVYGTMTGRDGKTYKTFQTTDRNGKTWAVMAENMVYHGDDVTCYANTEADPDFVKHYGCLYNWYDAMKVCPEEWYLGSFSSAENFLTTVLPAGYGSIDQNTGVVTYYDFGKQARFWSRRTYFGYWDKENEAYYTVVQDGITSETIAYKTTSLFSARCYHFISETP